MDIGDNKEGESERTIVSGLVKHVPREYLEGRAVIVVGNMKPSKLRGVMSQGMLLCAMEQDSNGEVTKVGLLEPAEGSQAGDRVTLEGYTDAGRNVCIALMDPWLLKWQLTNIKILPQIRSPRLFLHQKESGLKSPGNISLFGRVLHTTRKRHSRQARDLCGARASWKARSPKE